MKDLENLKAYVPSLDIVGINTYGGLPVMIRWLKENRYNRPVVVTEFGPAGEWEQKKDPNDQPFDPYDQYKAIHYGNRWREIEAAKEKCFGGYAFVLGEQRNQGSFTYWNLNYEGKKREGYWTLAALYKGEVPAKVCPKITLLKVDRVKNLMPGAEIFLDTTVTSPLSRPLRFSYFISDIAMDPLQMTTPKIFSAHAKELSPGAANIRVPDKPGVYRVYVVADDNKGNTAIASRSLSIEAPAP
jgi:hypothetical protein